MADDDPPHRDPARFADAIESTGPDGCLVVISHWMGPAAQAVCQAEDVWQEALVQAWRDRERHTWTGPREYRRWLLTIAKNRLVDIVRAAATAKRGGTAGTATFTALVQSGDGSVSDILPAGSVTPSRIAGHRERAALLRTALDGLPEEFRDVVRLHLYEELPMSEVAATLGIGQPIAWYRFRRGSVLLAESLDTLRSRSQG